MEKVARKIFSGTVAVPTGHLKSAISIPSGKRLVTKIDAGGSEGRLVWFYVKQATGTPIAYSVRLVSSIVPYGDGEGSPANYNASPTGNPDIYNVIDPQVIGTPGDPVNLRRNTEGERFSNDDSHSPSNQERYLYLVIIPVSAGDATTWDVSITFALPR